VTEERQVTEDLRKEQIEVEGDDQDQLRRQDQRYVDKEEERGPLACRRPPLASQPA
jgi:hypothetical protein